MQSSDSLLRIVIPARFGSSRLPGKPLADLAGKPMVVRVYETVRAALHQAEIVIAVDDDRVMSILSANGISAVMTSSSHQSGTDRAAEVARILHWSENDIVLNVQGDEPLIPSDLLVAFTRFCINRHNFSMATIAAPMESLVQVFDPNVVKVNINSQNNAITFSRAPIPFYRDLMTESWPLLGFLRHVGIYAYRNDVLQYLTGSQSCALEQAEKLEQLRALWLGIPIHVMCWHQSPPHGVDTPDDVKRVSSIFNGMVQ